MFIHTKVAILDDDHVTRMARFALAGETQISLQWVRDFFLPEEIAPANVFASGEGLHAADGVSLLPISASADLRSGSDVSIIIFRRGIIDAAFMDANPKLKLIQRLGARSDGIDVEAAAARGILVSCVPRQTLQYTAEHAILLMLAVAKRLLEGDRAVREGRWNPERVHPENRIAYNWAGLSNLGGLFQKTVGIVGLGEVGALTATMARGFAARVIYTNRKPLPRAQELELGVSFLPFSELLAESDFLSIHANNLPENKAMIDGAVFARMKPTSIFINTSRGRMVDEDALYAALTERTIAGAGLDVHNEEPRPATDRFASAQRNFDAASRRRLAKINIGGNQCRT
jgi:lactate dehydrogenase-like 2-hydroxyacid dehydrogenase